MTFTEFVHCSYAPYVAALIMIGVIIACVVILAAYFFCEYIDERYRGRK